MRISDWSSDVCSSDLGYWNRPEATADKFAGDWMLTGDLGRRDGDGYLHYVGRDDDVITSAGYRIGPGEIEDCLAAHPAVAMAAVIGVPDPLRTEAVKACVVLAEGAAPSEALKTRSEEHMSELQSLMRISYAVFCLKKKKK